VVNIAHNAQNIVRALANGAITFIREADRAEAETWSIKMEATADHPAFAPRHRRGRRRCDMEVSAAPANAPSEAAE
jgi:hypothetical protein